MSAIAPPPVGPSPAFGGAGPGGRRPIAELGSNENPLGASPRAVARLRLDLAQSHRYPEPDASTLRARLAEREGVTPDRVVVGPGSTALIDLLCHLLLDSTTSAVVPERSFLAYSAAVDATGARRISVPLWDDTINLDAVLAAIAPDTQLVFLANPNNPTGTQLGPEALLAFLDRLPRHVLVVLDEAYIEYGTAPPMGARCVREGRPVIGLRTFSKVHGLAGLRIGYAVGPAGIVGQLTRRLGRFAIARTALVAAEAALDDDTHLRRSVATNQRARERLCRGLERMGLRPPPSATNFVYVPLGRPGAPVAAAMLRAGVRVRALDTWGAPDALRIGVGVRAEVDRALEALEAALAAEITA